MSIEGSERLIRKATSTPSTTSAERDPGAQGQHPEVHRGRLPRLGLPARGQGVRRPLDGGLWHSFKNLKGGPDIIVKDVITDAMLQQVLLRPAEYDVLATTNLNGDYISTAWAAEAGGIGIAPGANMSDTVAMFEATHGTAPRPPARTTSTWAPRSSAEMMLRHMGWVEAADAIIKSRKR